MASFSAALEGRVPSLLPSRGLLLVLYVACGVAAGTISLALGQSLNLSVFRHASWDLLAHRDLYQRSADDYFKYSPTFALAFVPFAMIPAALAAPVWGALNFGLAFLGVDRAVDAGREKRVALVVALPGILLATDGDQSNLLVGGVFLLNLALSERARVTAATSLTLLAAHVKLFPIASGVFLLFQPRRWRTILAFATATAVWTLLPLVVLRPAELLLEYRSWLRLLAWDSANAGWSAMHLVADVLGVRWGNRPVQAVGILACVVPLALGLARGTTSAWRRTYACLLLTVVVLFNHRAEYASFVLPAMALGVWYATRPSGSRLALALLSFVAVGPFFARPDGHITGTLGFFAAHRLFHPLRVVPLLAIMCIMQVDLLRPLLARTRAAS